MSVASVIDFVESVLRLQVLTAPQQADLQTELAPRLADVKKVAADRDGKLNGVRIDENVGSILEDCSASRTAI
jgi:hypothetical protein